MFASQSRFAAEKSRAQSKLLFKGLVNLVQGFASPVLFSFNLDFRIAALQQADA